MPGGKPNSRERFQQRQAILQKEQKEENDRAHREERDSHTLSLTEKHVLLRSFQAVKTKFCDLDLSLLPAWPTGHGSPDLSLPPPGLSVADQNLQTSSSSCSEFGAIYDLYRDMDSNTDADPPASIAMFTSDDLASFTEDETIRPSRSKKLNYTSPSRSPVKQVFGLQDLPERPSSPTPPSRGNHAHADLTDGPNDFGLSLRRMPKGPRGQ